jgi:drug/metabolite transporter (DMT)-like permease
MTGEMLALLSASCFAGSNVTIARGAGAKAQDNGAFLSILMTATLAAAIWIFGGLRVGWTPPNASGMLWFAGAGVLTIFIGRVFLYASVQHLGAVRASAVKRLNPIFSVLLGVLVLREPMDSSLIIGMLLIFASFGVLVKQSLSASAASAASPQAQSWMRTLGNLGFFYGPISALAYATGYVARKQGLLLMPDPAFGTMLGSMVGTVFFLLAAQFVDSYRQAVRNALTSFNPWLFAAGLLSSAGQLLYFAALSYSTISRVALISSMEVFVTMFLTVVVFRSREQLNGPVLLAAAMGVAGTVFVVLRAA